MGSEKGSAELKETALAKRTSRQTFQLKCNFTRFEINTEAQSKEKAQVLDHKYFPFNQ